MLHLRVRVSSQAAHVTVTSLLLSWPSMILAAEEGMSILRCAMLFRSSRATLVGPHLMLDALCNERI